MALPRSHWEHGRLLREPSGASLQSPQLRGPEPMYLQPPSGQPVVMGNAFADRSLAMLETFYANLLGLHEAEMACCMREIRRLAENERKLIHEVERLSRTHLGSSAGLLGTMVDESYLSHRQLLGWGPESPSPRSLSRDASGRELQLQDVSLDLAGQGFFDFDSSIAPRSATRESKDRPASRSGSREVMLGQQARGARQGPCTPSRRSGPRRGMSSPRLRQDLGPSSLESPGHYQGWSSDRKNPSHTETNGVMPVPTHVETPAATEGPAEAPSVRPTAATGATVATVATSKSAMNKSKSKMVVFDTPSAENTRRSLLVSRTPDLNMAFVVNVSRFIDKCELLGLLHMLLESTAVAALTMVVATTRSQARNTGIFVVMTYLIYFLHQSRYDILEISDMVNAVDLRPSSPEGNWNSIFKCMTLKFRGPKFMLQNMLVLCVYVLSVAGMYIGTELWDHPCPDDYGLESCPQAMGLRRELLALLVSREEPEGEALMMQLMVFFMILMLHCWFEWVIWYETRCTMPRRAGGKPWDLSSDGVPLKFRLFGLPSMWFTGKNSKERLKAFMSHLHGHGKQSGVRLFPEQIAKMAIGSQENRDLMVQSLKHCSFYDRRDGRHDSSDRLDIDLFFYTDSGEYLSFPIPEDCGNDHLVTATFA